MIIHFHHIRLIICNEIHIFIVTVHCFLTDIEKPLSTWVGSSRRTWTHRFPTFTQKKKKKKKELGSGIGVMLMTMVGRLSNSTIYHSIHGLQIAFQSSLSSVFTFNFVIHQVLLLICFNFFFSSSSNWCNFLLCNALNCNSISILCFKYWFHWSQTLGFFKVRWYIMDRKIVVETMLLPEFFNKFSLTSKPSLSVLP